MRNSRLRKHRLYSSTQIYIYMKKLYTISLTMLTLSMSVAAASTASKSQINDFTATLHSPSVTFERNAAADHLSRAPKYAAEDEIPTADELAGVYEWKYYSFLSGISGDTKSIIVIEKGEEEGKLSMTFDGWKVAATYDETTGTISVESNQFITYNEYNKIDVYFYHSESDGTWMEYSFLDTPLEIKALGSELVFGDHDIVVIGLMDVGYFIYGGYNEATKQAPYESGIDMENGWEEVGTGTFYDGWILSGMGMTLENVMEEGYGVENVVVECNADGLYRLNNPYQVAGSIFLDYNINISETPGYIVFDLSDPEFVPVIPGIYAGMTDMNMDGSTSDYFNANQEGYFSIVKGYSKDTIMSSGAFENISNFDASTGTVMFYNCCFGDQYGRDIPYVWPCEMTGMFVSESLKNTGVESIGAGSDNLPKEYFNMQGQRVAHPERGLYIVRQGEKAEKIVF